MDRLSTDEILDIAEHIEKNGGNVGEFLAAKGLEFEKIKRAVECLVPEGERRRQSYQGGILLGLQLGAMRLDPIEFTPPQENEKPKCNCLLCQIERTVQEADE